MTHATVLQLAKKDWDLWRNIVFLYAIGSIIGLVVLAYPSELAFYSGSVLMITALVASGIHLIMVSVINERKLKTLPLIMSLPITVKDYTSSKMLVNLLMFTVVWVAVVAGTIIVTLSRETIPNGLITIIVILTLEIFIAYCLILAVAMITESEGWTIATMVMCNLFLNLFLFMTAKIPAIGNHLTDSTAVWSPEALRLIAVELLMVAIILFATYYRQSKKTDFM